MTPTFLIVAPPYTHRSAGIRALYRLSHHLNATGYPTAVTPIPGLAFDGDASCGEPFHDGPVNDAVVIYPEVVRGNPYGAARVVRWVLANPGQFGGDTRYADDEMVFVFNPDRLPIVNRAVAMPLGVARILNIGLVDPTLFHDRGNPVRDTHAIYTGRGAAARVIHPLPPGVSAVEIEQVTPSLEALAATLRRTKTLYAYEHATNILREAAICGCRVRVLDDAGRWHDPETCQCPHNIHWDPGFRQTYARRYHDHGFVQDFVNELRTRWYIPFPRLPFRLRRRAESLASRIGIARRPPPIRPRSF